VKCLLRSSLWTLLALSLFACAKANDRAASIDPRTGKHPGEWAVAEIGGKHTAVFLSGPSACFECHGRDLTGGISKVSCFSTARSGIDCHAGGPSGHPDGWASADSHGGAAKSILSGVNGMAHCQVCHGADFTGGIAGKSCLNTAGCHGAGSQAAHPAAPWRSTIGGRTHTDSDASNAVACAVCHASGTNSSRKPSPAAPAGTAPGCFTNTLCHGVEGHLAGWNLPSAHGAAAKAQAGGNKGFVSCQQCHGVGFDGGIAEQSCLKAAECHGADTAAPHPAAPWHSATGGVSHTTTHTSNAGQCAACHTAGANSTRAPRAGDPAGSTGCYNNTLCHGALGHAPGWSDPARHGAETKKAPSAATGFSSCQACHGAAFNNGPATSCMNNPACHGSGINSPHARKPWFSATGGPTHTTTDPANAPTCAICHTGGANSTIRPPNPATGAAGCFNNTLCHFHQIPFAPSATIPPTLHGGEAKKDLTVCQACHGVKGTTAFDGLVLADGTRTIACPSCHTFARAHPTDWQGSGTFSHRTAGNRANACALCHDVTQGRAVPLPAAPSCFSATFTNGAGQSRTCHAGGPGVAPHNVPYNNHNATARGNFNYCLGCHQVSADVTTASGKTIPRCLTCHLFSPVATPTGCTSCHAKPPAGAGYPDFAGLHPSHNALNVAENPTLTAICDQCHSGLGFGTVDHLNRARLHASAVQAGPVVFGTLAGTGGLVPTYTPATQQCANTYCHGNTLDKPASAILSPAWTAPFLTGSAAADCGRCHGYPPVTAIHGGVTPAQCSGCHPHVNGSATGFTDPTRHIDGSIEFTGAHSFPNPGSTHKAAVNGTGCLGAGCHAMGTGAADSPYPVAAGIPPNCRSCHLGASPTSNPSCSDCHGTLANNGTTNAGRPAAATFPNRQGEHNRAEHRRTCTTCHPFTTGDSRHGWSNRAKSANAQVLPSLNWSPGSRAPGEGSCIPSAGGFSGCHNLKSGWY
jgi:predicted CxxxxCH...CXXCH cytochrome family protein